MADEITVQQIKQLYEQQLIDIGDCAYIFNIKPMSVHVKFQRLKNNKLKRLYLWPGEQKRLIECLEEPLNAIKEYING